IETLAVPAGVAREVPLVIHPETHSAGELRFLISERRLSLRCQPVHTFVIAVTIMSLRALVQRVKIRQASLLVCISGVFRSHLVKDYGFPAEATVVIPNPVRLERFSPSDREPGEPPIVLGLGRIAVRKGIEDVVAAAHMLSERNLDVKLRIVGGRAAPPHPIRRRKTPSSFLTQGIRSARPATRVRRAGSARRRASTARDSASGSCAPRHCACASSRDARAGAASRRAAARRARGRA